MKRRREYVRSLRKSCVIFFSKSPVAVPKLVAAGSKLPVETSIFLSSSC